MIQHACQEGMQFSSQSSDAWRSGHVLQSIHTRFSQHPDVTQASTELIRQLHLNFLQSESKLPPAFMTGCSSAKSWLNSETWVDDRLESWQTHFSSISKSYLHGWNQRHSWWVETTQHNMFSRLQFSFLQLSYINLNVSWKIIWCLAPWLR